MTSRVTITLDDLIRLKADARGFSLSPRQPVSSLLAGRHTSRLRGRGLTFEELRVYHEGDDIRLIDWKATARLRSTHVRVFNEERERPILFVVDQRSPMFFGSQRAMKSVAAAELAALGAWRTLDSGDRVGGLIFNEQEVVYAPPHRSQSRVMQLFQHIVDMNQKLATGEPVIGSTSLNDALRTAASVAKHDHLVVLISDLDAANNETRRLAIQIAARNDLLVAGIYDPLGATLVGSAGMVASDRGKAWEIPSHDSFANRFRESFQRLLNHWHDVFRNLKIPVMPISTVTPVIDQIRSLIGNRVT